MRLPRITLKPRTHSFQLTDELLVSSAITSKGTLVVDQDIQLDNRHHGDVVVNGHLIIGPNADLHGNIKARSIDQKGSVVGNLTATEKIWLRANSALKKSELRTEQLEANPGSQLIDVNITTK